MKTQKFEADAFDIRNPGSLRAALNVESTAELDVRKAHIEVANNAAKLALTDLNIGQEVLVTGEANRLEKYMGDLGINEDATPIRLISFTYDDAPNVEIIVSVILSKLNGRNQYVFDDVNYEAVILWTGTRWEIIVDSQQIYTNPDDVEYPWEITSPWVEGTDALGDDSPPVFEKWVQGNDANWEIIGANTFELLVKHLYGGGDAEMTIGGVAIPDTTSTTALGWFRAGEEISFLAEGDGIMVGMTHQPSAWKINGDVQVGSNSGMDNRRDYLVAIGLGFSAKGNNVYSGLTSASTPYLTGWSELSLPEGWIKFSTPPARGSVEISVWSLLS